MRLTNMLFLMGLLTACEGGGGGGGAGGSTGAPFFTGGGIGATGGGSGSTGGGGGMGGGAGSTGGGAGSTGGGAGSTGGGAAGGTHGPAAAPAASLQGTPFSWQGYSVIIPQGMAVTEDGTNGFVAFDRPGCRISLWPMDTTGPDADAQALALMHDAFSDARWSGIVGQTAATPLLDTYHRRGVAGAGWHYVDLQGRLLNPSGAQSGEVVRVLLADLGQGRSALVLGYQEATGGRDCLTEVLNPTEWILLTYSLSFPGAVPANPHAFRDELVGGWFGATQGTYIDTGWSDIFAANGRYSWGATINQYNQLTPSQYLETSSNWAGLGSWALEGNLLERWPDDPSRPASTNLVRLVKEYNTSTPQGWRWYLYKLALCGGAYCEGWASHE